MKFTKSWGFTLIAALLVSACGGGDPDVPGSGSPTGGPTTKGNFTALVTFGDSLSDLGTYAPATSGIGGKFTTNSATSKIWVENLAADMGVTTTVAEAGFNGASVPCPAANTTCTSYGQGGARVTNPNGIGKKPTAPTAALTVPVVTQIANHLARFTSFKDTDLIFVWAGNNDVLVQFGAFAAAATQIQTQAALGNITSDEASRQLFAAQTAAQTEIKKAAQELTGYIRNEILAKGGKYVAVVNLPDIVDTPLPTIQPIPVAARPVLTDLSRLFNLWLNDGLTGQPVRLIDVYSIYKNVKAYPSLYGFTEVSQPACSVAKIAAITSNQVLDGSSLFCNSTPGALYNGLTTGADPTTWLFADTVHPTTGGHKALSDAFEAQLQAAGWL